MGPAECQLDALPTFSEGGIAAIAVDLQDAGEVTEMRLRPFAFAVAGIDIGDQWWGVPTPWAIIAGIGP